MDLLALLTAVMLLTAAIVKYVVALRKDVQEIHVMVNSRMNEALARIDQLDATLRAEGIESPLTPKEEVDAN